MANFDEQIFNGALEGGANETLAKFIVAQARHESGNYSSNQFKTNNNPFGFKYSKNSKVAKKGNVSPEGDSYAKYDSLADAIKDYIGRWYQLPSKKGGTRLSEFKQYDTTEKYARGLHSYGYFSDGVKGNDETEIQTYIRGINNALKRVDFQKFVKPTAYALMGVLVFSMIFYSVYIIKKNK